MTNEELQTVVSAVIQALKTNGKTIDQLTPVTSLANSDSLEVSGGKKIAFSKLKELVASAVVVTEESIKSWVVIESTDALPVEPTTEEQMKAYVLADKSTLYVYVGEGGDTLNGSYQSVIMKGADGNTGPKGDSGVSLGDVVLVNDLTTGGEGNALSAEMGKELKVMVDNIDATIDSVDTGLAEVNLNIKFSLTQNLTDLTSSVDAYTVNFGDALTVTLTAESGYTVGTCRVTMGGSDITSTAYSNNVVYIAEVTGDVVITAVAAEAGNIPVQFADTAVETIILSNTTHANPSYITEEEALLVTQIGSGYSQGSWFNGNTEITSFDELGKFGVTSLYEGAFKGCSALESIDIIKISALTTRDGFGSTFMGCTSLVKIKTSNTLTTIPQDCFRNCTGLRVVDLGESVTTLKSTALLNTSNDLKTIVMRSTTPPNYEYTWTKRGGKLYVPDEAFDAYQATDWGTNYPAVADSYGTQMLKLSDYVEK